MRRRGGAMIWHRDLALDRLPLSWARAENVRRAEVYVRPARGHAWPVVFLDDVLPREVERLAQRRAGLLVRTSRQGGYHVWLACARRLAETERAAVQRRLARASGADLRSTSGEHLGRLAGFKNWKRGGCWVGVARISDGPRISLLPTDLESSTPPPTPLPPLPTGHGDTSPSGRDWAWVCAWLERGDPQDLLLELLVQRARSRRGNDAERYARVTVQRALRHIQRRR